MTGMPPVAIAVMAKAPVPGRCKTRLQPHLSPAQSAALSAAFLRDITENLFAAAAQAALAPVVAYAPAGDAHLFDGHLAPGTQLLLADGSIAAPPGVAGFGNCLWHAFVSLFAQGFGAVCVLNADSPTLPTAYLAQAAHWLSTPGGPQAVIGPAEDGGYYLLGLRQPHPALLSDISWSTHQVAAQTRARAAAQDIALAELPLWYDVDDAASLARLRGDLAAATHAGTASPALPFSAPATRALLASLDPARGIAAE